MKRFFNLLLVGSLCSMTLTAQEWTYPTEPIERLPYEYGLGTLDAPYVITSAQQLADLAWYVNHGASYSKQYFELGADIDLNPHHTFHSNGTISGDGEPQRWVPIGAQKSFKANFDGKGHTVKGLYSDTFYAWDNNDWGIFLMGLFGYALDDTLCNLIIDNSLIRIDHQTVEEKAGRLSCGTMVGNASDCVIYGCKNTASISFVNPIGALSEILVGGLVGSTNYISGTSGFEMHDCVNTGDISFEGTFTWSSPIVTCGGIVGQMNTWTSPTITNCENYGNVIGGFFAGGIFGRTEGGSVLQHLKNLGNVSALMAGGIGASTSPGVSCDLLHCSNDGDVTSGSRGGGLIGEFIGGRVVGCHNRGNIIGGSGLFSYSYVTRMSDCSNTGEVVGGCGLIETAQYLQEMTDCHNTGNVIGASGILGQSDFGNSVWDEASGTWKDEMRITRCYNTGNVRYTNVENAYAAGILSGSNRNTFIENCYNQGDIEGISELRTGQGNGIYGQGNSLDINIRYCYNTGNISGSTHAEPISPNYITSYNVSDSYYLADCIAPDLTPATGQGKSLDEFRDGVVCILLNAAQDPTPWGQEIGTDLYPVLSGTGNPPTGITSPTVSSRGIDGTEVYDLTGRKIRKGSIGCDGIYISNRKKLLIR